MKKLIYDVFVLELTRRCTLKCAHCCKGDAQNMDMPIEVLHKALDNLATKEEFEKNGIFTQGIALYGGEPFLNADLIHECVNHIIENNIFILTFQAATSGTVLDPQIAMDFNRIQVYTEECWKIFLKNTNFKREKWDLSNLPVLINISFDFHDREKSQKALKFYRKMCNENVTVRLREESEYDVLYYRGRTKDIFRSNDKKKYLYIIKNDRYMVTEITGQHVTKNICVAANGNVYAGLMSEYDLEDRDNLGNVFAEDISSMVEKWNFQYPMLKDEAKQKEDCDTVIFNYENDNKEQLIKHIELNGKTLEEEYRDSEGKVYLYNVIKNYRRAIHEKLPYLSMEEIKTSSDMWLEMEKKIANNQITEEECNQKMDTHYAELMVEHSYDDVKEFHKQYPYLTVEECKELQELNNRMATPSSSLLVFMFEKTKLLARANELEKLNDYRKEHIGSAFNAE